VQILEPIQNSAFLGIKIPRVLLSTIGQKYCPLWNYTDQLVTLTPGTIIGTVSPIQDILSVAQDNDPDTPYELPPYRHPNRRYAADKPRNFQPNGQHPGNYNFAQNSRENKILQPSQPTQNFPVIKHTYEELKIKIDNPDITPHELEKFRALITEFGHVFALSNAEIEGTDLLEYEIQVQHDSRPIRQRPYNYSEEARLEIER